MKRSFVRLIVASDRLTRKTARAIHQAQGKADMIPAVPVCFLSFEGDLAIDPLDEHVARQKAAADDMTLRWFEAIGLPQAYLVTISPGMRFVYVISAGDWWLSFLFLNPSNENASPEAF